MEADQMSHAKQDRKQQHCPLSHGPQGQPRLAGLNPRRQWADPTYHVKGDSGAVFCPISNGKSGQPREARQLTWNHSPPGTEGCDHRVRTGGLCPPAPYQLCGQSTYLTLFVTIF